MSEMSSTTDLPEFHNKYKLSIVLGEGNFSTVRECITNDKDRVRHAVKIVKVTGSKEKREATKAMMLSEVSIMQKIHNANIIKCIDSFFGSETIFVVLESTRGGDLYDHIINTNEASEAKACDIIKDIANALQYLHSMQIVHRDIKPENFLIFYRPDGGEIIKLCDFGLAVHTRQLLIEICGSPSYVAPEVLRRDKYGLPVDIWSFGVVCYILLSHIPPFFAENTRRLFQKILKGHYEFPSPYWDNISESAKNLIERMLTFKPDKRIKIAEVISHPWMHEAKEASKGGDDDQASSKTLKSVAIAVRCVQRFAEPLLKPTRERAILTKSFMEGCSTEK